MWTAKWILDTYEDGSEAVRLEMYLTYPDLRCYFDELDIRPEKPVEAGPAPASGKSAVTWWSQCCRLVKS